MQDFKELLPGVKENVLLKDHTTYQIGGPARYFFVAPTKEDVLKALSLAKEHDLEVLVLGGGSNLLVSDEGFKGLVVKVAIEGHKPLGDLKMEAGAGCTMKELVDFSVEHSLEGIEWAGGLPGTFGGAIRGNAGAFGGEIKDSLIQVHALDNDLNLVTLSNDECRFAYRSSIFKEKNWIVLSAVVQFKPGNKAELIEIAESRRDFRKTKHPLEYPNSGSVFKNTPLSKFSDELKQKFAHVVKRDPFDVIPTAVLISELGLKGRKIGNAEISTKHPNFLVNLGGAKATDVLGLIEVIKKEVQDTYGVDLEVEVQLVGFGK